MAPTLNPQSGTGINQDTQASPNKLYQGEDLAKMGSVGTLPSYGSGWANACNTPWRLYKHYGHEDGISSPPVGHWPAGVKAKGEFRPQIGHLIDLMATCIDMTGAKYPADLEGHTILPPGGLNLVPAFTNQPLKRGCLAWEHEGNRAIRQGKWKLVSLANSPWELYDIEIDRVELNNLAAREKAMAAQWDAWVIRTHMLPRPSGKTPSAAKKLDD